MCKNCQKRSKISTFKNKTMKPSENPKKFIKQFKHIGHMHISKNEDDGCLNLFLLPMNGRNFDYDKVSNSLLESVADYSLSPKTKHMYDGEPMLISKEARKKFKEATKNDGELGELLLFCLLEGFLEAPKILTKLELKTSNERYVCGSDGVHLKKISEKKYHLIFGESKTYKDPSRAFQNAFKSIDKLKKNSNSSGLRSEKYLISSQIDAHVDPEDKDLQEAIKSLLYPYQIKTDKSIDIDDAFSILVCYEIDISKEREELPNEDFALKIQEKVINQIKKYLPNIYKSIKKHDLLGSTFYIFVIPFTDINKYRKKILKDITS